MANQFDLDRFDDCPTKRWLQSQIYSDLAKRMKSNVMMIAGPAIERHISDGFKIASTPKAKIHLVEKDFERYKEMVRRYGSIPNKPKEWAKKITLIHGDILLCDSTRFEDLDLCQTLSSLRYLVGHRLLLQSKLGGSAFKLRKCMLITASLRHYELNRTLDALFNLVRDILGAKVALWSGTKGEKHSRLYKEHGVKEYSPYIESHGRLLLNGLRFYTYRDGAPMFSCVILYV
jgi:hypothetical protein